jgi:hypothetical protein
VSEPVSSSADRLLVYFDRAVLAKYRDSPNLYTLVEDDMGGLLRTVPCEDICVPYIEMRFGFRRLADGSTCLAVFAPDLKRLDASDFNVWMGHFIEHPVFAVSDSAFERWRARYLEGSWEADDGPRIHLERLVRLLRALTAQTLGIPLFRSEGNPHLNYPDAENTYAYTKAHLELSRLLIEGLNGEAVKLIADHIGKSLTDPSKTLNSLREILPKDLHSVVYEPLHRCNRERNAVHSDPSLPVETFEAFKAFNNDLALLESALRALTSWLESLLNADAENCLRREEVMQGAFPHFSQCPPPPYASGELMKAVGKTISAIEYGHQITHPDVHQAEAVVVHFSDGTSMAIIIGSNASNVASQYDGLKSSDFSADFMFFWAPASCKTVLNESGRDVPQ